MKKLSHIFQSSDFHIEGFGLLLFVLGFHYVWIWPLLCVYLWKLRKTIKLSFFLIICVLITFRFAFFQQKKIDDMIHQIGIVTRIEDSVYQDIYTVKFDYYLLNIYDKKDSYKIGDQLLIRGNVQRYRSRTVPHGFDRYHYYLSQNIHGYIINPEVQKQDRTFSILSYRYALLSDFDHYQSYPWIQSLIFGQRIQKDEISIFKHLNIQFLLQASGLHIFILVNIIKKICLYLDVSYHYQVMICGLIYILFFYLQQFDMGSMRLLCMFCLVHLNDVFKWRLTKLDLIQVVFIIMLICNIHWLYHVGFLILYIILNVIALITPMIKPYDSLMKRMIISFTITLFVCPFTSSISLFTVILLPLFTFLLTGPLFMMVVLTLFFNFLDPITASLFALFSKALLQIDRHNIYIPIPSLSNYLIFIYIILLIYTFRSKTTYHFVLRLTLTLLILMMPRIQLHLDPTIKIYFLDVGQGDAIYLSSPHCHLLIDAHSPSLSFLKDHGVTSLDYLILSHSDEDHTKNAYDITRQLNVKKLILSPFDKNHKPYPTSIQHAKAHDHITCGKVSLEFFSPTKRYDSDNHHSLVFKMIIGNLSILFTGDIEQTVESDLVRTYGNQLSSDILKVPHHGSISSSTEAFIDAINPSYGIISVGEFNRFKFPSEEVIHRYTMRGIKIYRTDTHGTIVLHYQQKKEKWTFHLPYLPYV